MTEQEHVRRKPEAEEIIELALDDNKFFKDQFGSPYGLVRVKDHFETLALEVVDSEPI